jgi:hypothetical protein
MENNTEIREILARLLKDKRITTTQAYQLITNPVSGELVSELQENGFISLDEVKEFIDYHMTIGESKQESACCGPATGCLCGGKEYLD